MAMGLKAGRITGKNSLPFKPFPLKSVKLFTPPISLKTLMGKSENRPKISSHSLQMRPL
jgi:hypothetical protein